MPKPGSKWAEGLQEDDAVQSTRLVNANATARSAPAVEPEFNAWLEKKLESEQDAFITRLRELLAQQLTSHHKALLSEVEANFSQAHKLEVQPVFTSEVGAKKSLSSYGSAQRLGMQPAADLAAAKGAALAAAMEGAKARVVTPVTELDSEAPREISGAFSVLPTTTMRNPDAVRVAAREGLETRRYRSEYIAGLSSMSSARSIIGTRFFGWKFAVKRESFEIACCVLILVNIFVMALEVQHIGCQLARSLQHDDCQEHKAFLGNPALEDAFKAASITFCCLFTLEFIVRLEIFRQDLLGWQDVMYNVWLWLDMAILGFAWIDVAGRLGSTDLRVNPTVGSSGAGQDLRAMRAARMTRMLRMLKFFKVKESFHTLFLLLKSILASRHALIWSVLILYFTMTCVGLLMNQLMFSYLSNQELGVMERREVFDYFGTYTRMLITMFELTLGNWAPPCRVLMSNVSQWWGVFIVVYRCIFCFALVHVTGAVFITETSRVAADDEVQIVRKQQTDSKTARILSELFKEMDTSGDGSVTLDELKAAVEDKVVKGLLEILDLEVRDIEELYALLDDGSGRVPHDLFVADVLQLRGPAKSSKQVAMMKLIRGLGAKMDEVSARLDSFAAVTPLRR